MDFAKKILNKYGWKDGDGLGKNNDGISKPLKANLKFDNAGFGADQATSDFNNHWWERVFNEAANNVAIKSDKDGVSMNLKNPNESVEITTKGYSIQKLKKMKTDKNDKYENFLQSATLSKTGDEVTKPDRITADEIEVQKFKQLTDDELFKACGGRTAHKGARHGLKLSGKLARLEMQEQELMAKMLVKKNDGAKEAIKLKTKTKILTEDSSYTANKRNYKKSKRKNEEEPLVQDMEQIKSKKKRKTKEAMAPYEKVKTSCKDLETDPVDESDTSPEKTKKKKSKKPKPSPSSVK